MSIHEGPWTAGTPCWIDLMTTDQEAARDFYGELFGWEFRVGPPETGGYATGLIGGRAVAGVAGMTTEGHPSVWSTYLATEDITASCAAAEKAGATIFAPPMEVMDLGSMAIVQVPGGGFTALWQAGTHTGFDVSNETGADIWNEFMTRDYAGARDFFAAVFGWTYTEMDGMEYSMINVGGTTVGGIGALGERMPAHLPPHWRTYFAVEDADAAVSKVVELGGKVLRPPTDMPYGRHADVADPQGATFALLKPAPMG